MDSVIKTLFPEKVSFGGPGGDDSNGSFWVGGTVQPISIGVPPDGGKPVTLGFLRGTGVVSTWLSLKGFARQLSPGRPRAPGRAALRDKGDVGRTPCRGGCELIWPLARGREVSSQGPAGCLRGGARWGVSGRETVFQAPGTARAKLGRLGGQDPQQGAWFRKAMVAMRLARVVQPHCGGLQGPGKRLGQGPEGWWPLNLSGRAILSAASNVHTLDPAQWGLAPLSWAPGPAQSTEMLA